MATFDEKYLASYKDAFMEVEGIDELENVLPSNKFPGLPISKKCFIILMFRDFPKRRGLAIRVTSS